MGEAWPSIQGTSRQARDGAPRNHLCRIPRTLIRTLAGSHRPPAARLNQRPLQFLHFGPSLGPTGAVVRSRTFIDAERLDVARQGRGLPGLEAQRTFAPDPSRSLAERA